MKKVNLFTILFLALLISAPLFAQKFAYVHTQQIFSEYAEYKEAEDKIAQIRNQYQTEYDQLVQEYTSQLKEIESQSLLLSPEKKQEKEKQMQDKALQIERFKYEKLGPQGELYAKQAELVQPINDKIMAAISKIGEDEGYDFIFDGANGILFAKPETDLTKQVLRALNDKTKTTK